MTDKNKTCFVPEKNSAGRQANLDLLRCVAMMMVVVLHYLGKGNLLTSLQTPDLYPAEYLAWLLESFCMVAVNVYMFISGYFLCTSSFRVSRLIQLVLQVWMYSVVFGLIGSITGVIKETPVDTHYYLTLLFPVSMNHYWFLTAYIFLYLLLPFLGTAVRRMTKRQLGTAVLFLLAAFSVLKSVLPARLETDMQGYDCLWYICVFAAAAYLRRFGVPFLEKRGRGIALYVVCCLMVFGGTMLLRQVFLRTGSLERMLKMCLEYNHILAFLAAAGLFAAFRRLKISGWFAAFVCRIAPYTLGVYLLHENLGLRYSWQKWLGCDALHAAVLSADNMCYRLQSAPGLVLYTAAAVVCVFAAGILTEMLRAALVRAADRILGLLGPYRKLKCFVKRLDETFREETQEPSL